jgi:serine/threonine-protein kinase
MAEQRYRVVDRIEAGGMAEVFRGEAQSVQGFRKQVAIKRVLPHLAQNQNFIAMFLDEARLGARLNHANIVSVIDIGAADNTYFIVMEFVDGANLKALMEGLRKQGQRFPMKEAIFICIEACRGLSYAHEAIDDGNEALAIVHRDVSPPNILISKRGEVKLTDFGLAKATTQLEKTDPGVVKGKFSYLSPEAAIGQPVDARADVFALGIVLWEMLAGRRLFLGETDYQTVKLVQQANIPSLRRLNPEVDDEFEHVLHLALARDPAQRFQTARDFGDALSSYIFKHSMKVTSYDIANLLKSTVIQKAKSSQDQSIIDRLIQEELLSFTSIDEMQDPLNPGARPLSPEDVQGASPLDMSTFENPADWFSDDADIAEALDQHATGHGSPGWREAGLPDGPSDLASLLEGGDTADVPPPAPSLLEPATDPAQPPLPRDPQPRDSQPRGPEPVASAPSSTGVEAHDSEPRAAKATPDWPASVPPERPRRSSGPAAWVYVVIVIVLLLGAGAAAFLGGVVP